MSPNQIHRGRGRPKLGKRERRAHAVIIRLTDEQYELLIRAAKADNFEEFAPWCRRALLRAGRQRLGIDEDDYD